MWSCSQIFPFPTIKGTKLFCIVYNYSASSYTMLNMTMISFTVVPLQGWDRENERDLCPYAILRFPYHLVYLVLKNLFIFHFLFLGRDKSICYALPIYHPIQMVCLGEPQTILFHFPVRCLEFWSRDLGDVLVWDDPIFERNCMES